MAGIAVTASFWPEAHDRALAELLFDLADGHLDGAGTFAVVTVFNWRHNAPDR